MNYNIIHIIEILKCYGIWDQTNIPTGIIKFYLSDYYGNRKYMKLLHGIS